MGEDGNLLLIDCRSNAYTLVPFGSEGSVSTPVLLVTNSNVKHELSGSEYPDRVRQCREAVQVLQRENPTVEALRDATLEMIDAAKGELSDLSYRRAKHCVTEDKRTLATVEQLGPEYFRHR